MDQSETGWQETPCIDEPWPLAWISFSFIYYLYIYARVPINSETKLSLHNSFSDHCIIDKKKKPLSWPQCQRVLALKFDFSNPHNMQFHIQRSYFRPFGLPYMWNVIRWTWLRSLPWHIIPLQTRITYYGSLSLWIFLTSFTLDILYQIHFGFLVIFSKRRWRTNINFILIYISAEINLYLNCDTQRHKASNTRQ